MKLTDVGKICYINVTDNEENMQNDAVNLVFCQSVNSKQMSATCVLAQSRHLLLYRVILSLVAAR